MVVKPIEIIRKLEEELTSMGVAIIKYAHSWKRGNNEKEVILDNGDKVQYNYLINSSGLYS